MTSYILAIDQGTTGTTLALINAQTFQFECSFDKEHKQYYPHPGEVEHDLDEIWNNVLEGIHFLTNKIKGAGQNIQAIGITNQRETLCAFAPSGRPLCKAIVWQDRRTSQFCHNLKKSNLDSIVKEKTGLTIDPYFTASKIHWLINNNPDAKQALKSNQLLLGTIDTFLLYKLTSGSKYATDATNASRTLLYNIHTNKWDNELLELFNLPKLSLPMVCDSFGSFGVTKNLMTLPDGIPISGILGDQQSALLGQGGINQGDIKCTYGTGAFILLNTGTSAYSSKHLLTTIAQRENGKTTYALEGSCFVAGAAIQYLRDQFKFFEKSQDCESLALEATEIDTKSVFFFPFFTGIGSPHWVSEARGSLHGLTRGTGPAHITRACLESIAFSVEMLLETFQEDFKKPLSRLNVDGGATMNQLLLQMQSETSRLTVIRPTIIETTIYGAALAAAKGINLIQLSEIKKLWQEDYSIGPKSNRKDQVNYLRDKYEVWKKLLAKTYLN